jgi:hypothetical protein
MESFTNISSPLRRLTNGLTGGRANARPRERPWPAFSSTRVNLFNSFPSQPREFRRGTQGAIPAAPESEGGL